MKQSFLQKVSIERGVNMDEFKKVIEWLRKNELPLLMILVATNIFGVVSIIILALILFMLG